MCDSTHSGFPQTSLGFNVCVDEIVRAGAVLNRANVEPSDSPKDLPIVRSAADLSDTFTYYFRQGAAAERVVDNAQLWSALLHAASSKSAKSRAHIGGNAALMAQQLATVCNNCTILLGGGIGPKLAPMLDGTILQLGTHTSDEVHLILEYSRGDKWGPHVAPRANRFILTADSANTDPATAEAVYSHLRGTNHSDIMFRQKDVKGDGIPDQLHLLQAREAAERLRQEAIAAAGEAGLPADTHFTATSKSGQVKLTIDENGEDILMDFGKLPFHDPQSLTTLPPHYFGYINPLAEHSMEEHGRQTMFRMSVEQHGHINTENHFSHGHVHGDGLPSASNVLVIAGLHMYESLAPEHWITSLQTVFGGVHTLPGFPLVHAEVASMGEPAFAGVVAEAVGANAHSMGLNEQELHLIYVALGGKYVDEIIDTAAIDAVVTTRMAHVLSALVAKNGEGQVQDFACEELMPQAVDKTLLECASHEALLAFVQSDAFDEGAPHAFEVNPEQLTLRLTVDALGKTGQSVAMVHTKSDLVGVVPKPEAVASAVRFILANSPALCRVHFHSLAFHMTVQRDCLIPQILQTWELVDPEAPTAAAASAATLKACGANHPSELQESQLDVIAPLRVDVSDPVARAGVHPEPRDVRGIPAQALLRWEWEDLRRFHFAAEAMYRDSWTDFRSVTFVYTPVPVCKAPVATVGLGDAISATGLGYHVRATAAGMQLPRPTKHSIGHPGSSSGSMGIPAPGRTESSASELAAHDEL